MPFPENSGADRLGVTHGVATNPVFRPGRISQFWLGPQYITTSKSFILWFCFHISKSGNVIKDGKFSIQEAYFCYTIEGLLKGGLMNAREMHPCLDVHLCYNDDWLLFLVLFPDLHENSLCCCCCSVAQWCLTLCEPREPAFQVPLSMVFSRQEYWSRLPFLLQGSSCPRDWTCQS